MKEISVSNLKKYYSVYKRSSGLVAAFGSLFKRSYHQVQAVDDISFDISAGELVGFIGPNGAGKTTTLKCLAGLLHPTQGKIDVCGYYPFDRKTDFLKRISLVMGQKNQLWWDLPAIETFRLNKEIYEIEDDIFEKTLKELTNLLEIGDLIGLPTRQLSLGQRMKMELIASLIHRPKILFLDEPTIGLDVVMQKKIRDFILSYNRRFKATILLTSHYMTDVKRLCKRIIIIDRGKIIYDGELDKLAKSLIDVKSVSLVFGQKILKNEISELGKITIFDLPKVVLSVPRDRVSIVASKILKKYKIDDLTIEEPEIEEVIRMVFDRKTK